MQNILVTVIFIIYANTVLPISNIVLKIKLLQ